MTAPRDNGAADLMSAYLDQQLDPTQTRAFEDYLAESPEARAELDELRRMVKLVGSLPAVEAPPDLYEKVSRKVRRRGAVANDGNWLALVSVPFQVLSILVILIIAALYMMAELERDPSGQLEHDPVTQPDETKTQVPVVP